MGISPYWEVDRPSAGQSVLCYIINIVKDILVSVVYRLPSPLQFGACDPGYYFLGSGGEPTEVVVVDLKVKNKSRKMSREQSDEEDGVVETEVGRVDDETAETEVDCRPPRGTNRMIGESSWEPSEQRRTSVIRDSNTESGP